MGGVVTCGCSLWTNLGECKRGRERVENKIFVKCFTLVLYIYIYIYILNANFQSTELYFTSK